ncbi:MAG: response regulator [Alphaproteobacteria bacterium]|nr:response regulator [Alphaproteobacteria bacterium]
MAESDDSGGPADDQIKHALVLEDSELDSDLLSGALRAYGVRDISVVTDVTEIRDLPGGDRALVILDLILRNSDGFEAIRLLRERAYSGRLLIVSASARDMIPQAVQLARASGLNVIGGMTKPLDLAHLKVVLAESSSKV